MILKIKIVLHKLSKTFRKLNLKNIKDKHKSFKWSTVQINIHAILGETYFRLRSGFRTFYTNWQRVLGSIFTFDLPYG